MLHKLSFVIYLSLLFFALPSLSAPPPPPPKKTTTTTKTTTAYKTTTSRTTTTSSTTSAIPTTTRSSATCPTVTLITTISCAAPIPTTHVTTFLYVTSTTSCGYGFTTFPPIGTLCPTTTGPWPTATAWGLCGNRVLAGSVFPDCPEGWQCVGSNDFYSQCLPI